MSRSIVIFLLCLVSININAQSKRIESALCVLDSLIDDHSSYKKEKDKRITDLKHFLSYSRTDSAKYVFSEKLFHEYFTRNLDSAVNLANNCERYALNMGNKEMLNRSRINIATTYNELARFYEAVTILDELRDESGMGNNPELYNCYLNIVKNLHMDYPDSIFRANYIGIVNFYRTTIDEISNKDSLIHFYNKSDIYIAEGKATEGLNILLDYQKRNPEIIKDSNFLLKLSFAYKANKEDEAHKYYLILSAIEDRRNCNRISTSLTKLALLLSSEGDYINSYRYLSNAMDNITKSKARSKLIEVAEYMPTVTSDYANNEEKKRARLYLMFLGILILAILLLICTLILFRHNNTIAKTRRILKEKNNELKSLNDDLKILNQKLVETNQVKEAYIAQLFNICSGYIEDMDKYRTNLNQKFKAGMFDDIKRELSKSHSSTIMKDFLKNFDLIFLSLFPNFIESFNELLRPEERIVVEGKGLTPELRIYALVKLGINDSTKIASFLRYSTQTVYNYRLKIRNKAISDADDLTNKVQNI